MVPSSPLLFHSQGHTRRCMGRASELCAVLSANQKARPTLRLALSPSPPAPFTNAERRSDVNGPCARPKRPTVPPDVTTDGPTASAAVPCRRTLLVGFTRRGHVESRSREIERASVKTEQLRRVEVAWGRHRTVLLSVSWCVLRNRTD